MTKKTCTTPECFARDWRRAPKTPEKCLPCPWEAPCSMWVRTPKPKLIQIIRSNGLTHVVAKAFLESQGS